MIKTICFKLGMFFMIFNSFDLCASISTPFANEVKAVIFDCDGVLVDTEHLKFLAWQKALASVGIELSIEEYKKVAGHSSKKIHEILEEMKHLDIPEEVIYLRRVKYQELQAQGVPPIKDTVEFAHHLSQNKDVLGIKLGVASSASRNEILFNLKQIGFAPESFDLIISGSDDLEGYTDDDGTNKPKPYIYLEASKRLNIPPEHCLVFEDTESGIEAAVRAGMIAIAIPNWMTKGQDFSKANKLINSILELSIQHSDNFQNIPFKLDGDLEKNPSTAAHQCIKVFLQKGGSLQSISNLSDSAVSSIQLNVGDAVYPICSGGWCRSQALWAILKPLSDQIVLFPPHAARVGWDPYNGQINRYRNYAQEEVYDEFSSYFGMEKSLRFGFEHDSEWRLIEKSPSKEELQKITQFYDEHYFGPNSSWHQRQGKKRIYITFSNNAHVTLFRLNQSNENLKDVTVIAIDSEDLITYPPSFLNANQRSVKAYENFSNLLRRQINFMSLLGIKEDDHNMSKK